jgi:hypothetical protein
MPTQQEVQLLNETLFEQLDTPGMQKQAIDAVNDFTRTKMREDGFYRRIMPPLTITNDELDRQVDTDKPVKVVDKEPDSPAAVSLPFATLPINFYIRGPRYRVMFDRIVSPRAVKDVDELRTYVIDIRQVLSDNMIKDMLAEEDSKFIAAFNAVLPSPGQPNVASGSVQYEEIHGGITRETLVDALKVMPRTPSHFEVETCLVNNITIKEILKFGRDEMGGDFSQDIIKNGWAETNFLNCRWIVTIKRRAAEGTVDNTQPAHTGLIPDDSLFMFASPKFIGKNYELEPTTMYIRREAYMLEYFAYNTQGGSFGHTNGLARVDFK